MGALTTLGERIRYFRELKGWTQTHLARCSGIAQSRISKVENGDRKPYFWEVEKLAKFLDVPLCMMDTTRQKLEREKKRPMPLEKPALPPPRRRGPHRWGTDAGAAAT